jgi:hypothetical protein
MNSTLHPLSDFDEDHDDDESDDPEYVAQIGRLEARLHRIRADVAQSREFERWSRRNPCSSKPWIKIVGGSCLFDPKAARLHLSNRATLFLASLPRRPVSTSRRCRGRRTRVVRATAAKTSASDGDPPEGATETDFERCRRIARALDEIERDGTALDPLARGLLIGELVRQSYGCRDGAVS